MAFTEDLSPFFDTGDFGESATFMHASGSPVVINVIFDASFDDPLGIAGAFPRAVCSAGDVTGVVHGDTLVIGSTTYKVVGVKPDGTGVVILTLQQQ